MTAAILVACLSMPTRAGDHPEDAAECQRQGGEYAYTEENAEEKIIHCRKPGESRPGRVPQLPTVAVEPRSWFAWTWQRHPSALEEFSEVAVDIDGFARGAGARSLSQLIHERDSDIGVRSAGPTEAWRYVRDPMNPGRVIDMRHFLSVGSRRFLETTGFAIEVVQWLWSYWPLATKERRRQMALSAFDPQDFYSNALGAEFFSHHYKPDGAPLGSQIARFLSGRGGNHAAR